VIPEARIRLFCQEWTITGRIEGGGCLVMGCPDRKRKRLSNQKEGI